MGTVHCRDARTGVVYVYDSFSYWDKETKTKKARRKLIGKLDADGNVVPTNGRPGRPRKPLIPIDSEEITADSLSMKAEYERSLQSMRDAYEAELDQLRRAQRDKDAILNDLRKLVAKYAADDDPDEDGGDTDPDSVPQP